MGKRGNGQVFIVNRNPGHNYEGARKFGRLVAVTEGRLDIFVTDRLMIDLDAGLAGFREQEDYLLLSGNVVVNALAAMVLAWRHETVQLLVFDAKGKRYEPRLVSETILREAFREE